MWSHSISHKHSARLIYCTKCCVGIFLAQGVTAWRMGVKGREASCRPLCFICRARAPRLAQGGKGMVMSPDLHCRVFAPLFAACIWASFPWPGLMLVVPAGIRLKTRFSISMPSVLILPHVPHRQTRSIFSLSRLAVSYQAVLASPNYSLERGAVSLQAPGGVAQQGRMLPVGWWAEIRACRWARAAFWLPVVGPSSVEAGSSCRWQKWGCSSLPVLPGAVLNLHLVSWAPVAISRWPLSLITGIPLRNSGNSLLMCFLFPSQLPIPLRFLLHLNAFSLSSFPLLLIELE